MGKIHNFFILIIIQLSIHYTKSQWFQLPFEAIDNSQINFSNNFLSFAQRKNEEILAVVLGSSRRFYTKICIGSNNQCINAKISTTFPETWVAHSSVAPKGFDSENSETFSETSIAVSIPENEEKVEGFACTDTVRIGTLTQDYFTFVLTKSKITSAYSEFQASIGLGYLYKDYEFSILDKWFSDRKIEERVFYVQYFDDKNGIFTFGRYPEGIHGKGREIFKYKRCRLIDTKNEETFPERNSRFECVLNAVYFEDYEKNMRFIGVKGNRISFNFSGNILSFPAELFRKFVEIYIGSYISNNICQYESNDYMDKVICNDKINILDLGAVRLMIGKWSIKLGPKLLFKEGFGNFYFLIVGHHQIKTFLIGYNLMKEFTLVFDKERKEIGILKNEDL